MTSPADRIPPRPWRVVVSEPPWEPDPDVLDTHGGEVFFITNEGRLATDRETLELIVRLVNAEPEIVAALRAAQAIAVGLLTQKGITVAPAVQVAYDRANAALDALGLIPGGDAPPARPAADLGAEVRRTFAAVSPMMYARPDVDPDVVAALEAARLALEWLTAPYVPRDADSHGRRALEQVDAALAKVRP